ncbi:MAG: FKBP-type peptidyl-prolyl cis-trans isomerase FkpA [Colwellia sp.]|jgi:FKBP-type peptidyl-prolyl cis-trans isomerase FkpA|uniref:FKBP-type peptidyl-prolyl cis-trans isomerase n=1 Tax=unclassified Colwellia TaxID=196834 RepID=UPI000878D84D|nr:MULTISPECIES: FKBP-type peptidyl-prolyl cis-trans isomerase [unclassified Colwellia]MBA6362882.1 FKBP-type peptidyl-prolyl cis-trans isomerase [Colwellia sp. BRX8-8]AOW76848.1 peptidylprolyl isomerase [Colwellia sp. PAMC 20917]MBA6254190.1 FKBP-type peptidyl-prolyl cis-trans isomerase [Colwellia sp. MB3u-55]MBA6337984.1 FKBP-type peptidyl-prolyl cis-trans isomerase [Colwellia sp. BRX8-7]MBA6346897.1 FKBP-type peptidyl-prolyl cis-trans isomerase [Colwellia sp. BRX8-9]
MKLFKPTMLAIALVSVFGCQESVKPTETAPVLETEMQKQAYSLGASIGMYMQKNLDQHEKLGVPLDQALITRGFMDSLAGKSIIEKEEIQALLMSLDEQMKAKQLAAADAESEAAIAEGMKFLEENAKKEGVQVTESGIQYLVVTEGEGDKPSATDTVTVHYKGTFLNGETFDSSYERNEPAVFPLNRVISGWTEGVQLMSVGSKYTFTIPSDLAYGKNGNPPRIPGNSVLQFEIELLDIQKSAEPEEITQ